MLREKEKESIVRLSAKCVFGVSRFFHIETFDSVCVCHVCVFVVQFSLDEIHKLTLFTKAIILTVMCIHLLLFCILLSSLVLDLFFNT